MKRLQKLVIVALTAIGLSAGADEPTLAQRLEKSLDDANAAVNRELAKARHNTANAVDDANDKANEKLGKAQRDVPEAIDEANEKANEKLEKGRQKVPGLKKLQDATNNRK